MVNLHRNGSVWNRNERNRQNENWETIEKGLARMETVIAESQSMLDEAERVNAENVNTNKRLDNIIASSGTSSTEVVDARLDAEGNEYSVLKDRLDESDAQLAQKAQQIGSSNQRTRQSVWDEFEQRAVNAYWFGALGDGSNNDTNGIKAAIQYAKDNGYGKVRLSAGTFIVDPDEILLPSNIYLQGAGRDLTVVKVADDSGGGDTIANADQNDGTRNSNIKISDMTVDSNNTNRTSNGLFAGIRMRYVDNFHIENVYSKNSLGYGFDFWYSFNFILEFCDASDCWDDGISIAEESERGLIKFCNSWSNNSPGNGTTNKSGFEVEDGSCYITFENCRAWDNEYQNFDIHIHPGDPLPHHIVYKDCESFAPVLHHVSCSNAYDITLDGFICNDTGEVRGGFQFRNIQNLKVSKVRGEAAVRLEEVENVTVTDLDITLGETQIDGTGVLLDTVKSVVISNLVINKVRAYNVLMQGECEDIVINGFTFAEAGESGLRTAGPINRISFNNGTVKNCGQNTALGSTGRRAGLYINSAVTDITVGNLTVADTQTEKTQINGIHFSDEVNYLNMTNVNCRGSGTSWDLRYPSVGEVNATNIFADTINNNPN